MNRRDTGDGPEKNAVALSTVCGGKTVRWPRWLAVLLSAVLVLGLAGTLFALPVAATEDPRFEATVAEPLQPGEAQTLTVRLVNDAEDVDEQVEAAENVKVTAKSGSTPIEVLTRERPVGSLADGKGATVEFQIEVPTDAPAGTYQLPLAVTYEYDGERETTTVTATVEIPERPILTVESVETDLHPRETGVVTVTVKNDGSESANDTSLTLFSPTRAITVGDAESTTFLGHLPPQERADVTVPVTVTEAAASEPSELRMTPTYRNVNGIIQEAPTRTIGVQLADRPRIDRRDVAGWVSPGEAGTVEMTFLNRGETSLSEAVLHLEAGGPDLTLDGGRTSKTFLGEWGPGEEKTLRTEVRAAETVSTAPYPISATVAYEHPAGVQSESGPLELGVPVGAPDVIEYTDISVTHTGPEAVLSATVRNVGEQPIRDGVVDVESDSPGVAITDGASSVGTLEPGESATASAEVRVADRDRHPQAFVASVRYAGENGQPARTEAQSIWADLETGEDLFAVEPVNNTFAIDDTGELRVRITNEGESTYEDVSGRLHVREPYQSASPTASVPELAPGESTILAFEVTTPDDGVATTDALNLNLTAETASGGTVVDGPHRLPITVATGTEATGSSTVIAALALVVIVLLGGGWWWLNR
ncbi:MAG: hypothetical protein ACOCP3_01135 [Halodesulfurarchaeum sp.]